MGRLHWIIAVILLTACVTGRSGHAEEKKQGAKKPDPKRVKELMERKLHDSQRVLEGLATNDLAKVIKNAEDLLKLRQEEGFKVIPTKEYELWSDDFRHNVDSLLKAARAKNLEAAKLSYLGMSLSCFHCHTYVRDQGQTSLELNVTR